MKQQLVPSRISRCLTPFKLMFKLTIRPTNRFGIWSAVVITHKGTVNKHFKRAESGRGCDGMVSEMDAGVSVQVTRSGLKISQIDIPATESCVQKWLKAESKRPYHSQDTTKWDITPARRKYQTVSVVTAEVSPELYNFCFVNTKPISGRCLSFSNIQH